MDKYQEALNNVKRVYVESEHYDEEDFRLLQQLVDKETPKKPNHKYDECYVIYYCSNCKEEIPHRIILSDDTYCYTISYCPNCGQALDWSDEDEN